MQIVCLDYQYLIYLCLTLPLFLQYSTFIRLLLYQLVSAKQIASATLHDPVLSRVLYFTRVGWPKHNSQDELQPYWTKRLELTVEQGCLLWGIRVIVPPSLQDKVLEELHSSHPGISRMKAIARSYT